MRYRSAAVRALSVLGGVLLAGPVAGGSAPVRAAQAAVEAPPVQASPPPVRLTRSASNTSYAIEATLDPERRTLDGRAVLTWRNVTASPTAELYLHLYYNAWRDTRSTWLRGRALGGLTTPLALDERGPRDWGRMDLRVLRLENGGTSTDLLAASTFVAPDDGNPHDRTLLHVSLPGPVAPGAAIDVEVEWQLQVPPTFARTGARGDYFFLAHWFPKVAVLGDDGWIAHQFHASTEFFADFGTYDVRLDVPHGWIVGATGRALGAKDNGGTTTHRFLAEDVHDFAWTTSPDFVEHEARFEHAWLPGVDLRLLLQPEHVGQADRHLDATRAALRAYGEWYGPYPYDHLTIVDPAWGSGSGGMEYPTLFTAGTRWLQPRGSGQPESVTVHEAGHQFWYGVVASNEFRHAWLDEGLNTYSTSRVMALEFPRYRTARFFGGFVPWVFRDLPVSRLGAHGLARYRLHATADVPSTPTWQYFPATHAAITYSKTALWLETLERHLGWPTLQKALSAYFSRYSFKHPTPSDFFAVVNEVGGRDLTWFFDQVHGSARVFDYGVEDVQSAPVRLRGVADAPEDRTVGDEGPDEPRYETRVVVRRYGDGIFPVDVVTRFADGEVVHERWDGRSRWHLFEYVRTSPAASVEVDPERVLALDVNATNNSWSAEPASDAAGRRWSLTWLTWLQDLLLTYGFFV